jgi:hypothetical protein
MRSLITFLLVLLAFCQINAQLDKTSKWPKEDKLIFESAKSQYNKGYFNAAYEKYTSLKAKHGDDIYLKYVMGICAIYINDKQEESEKLLNEVKAYDKNTRNIDYYIALLYHKTYRFTKSLELINTLLSNPKLPAEDKAELERIAFFCRNGIKELEFPVPGKIENLGKGINSEYAEYSPVITPEEESMIFTYRGKESMGGLVNELNQPDPNGDYNEDIFISKKLNGVWQKPTRMSELSTVGNDAVIALSPDGRQLFVFKAEGDNGDIYVSKREGGKYGVPTKLAGDVNSPLWEGSVCLSTDQKKLFFASNRPGGLGGKDLYVATPNPDGSWGNVKNLGDKINTKYDEDAPFISPDGRVLIFSSEGHNSFGDFDLFTSDLNTTDDSWSEPKNLGYPINTTDDDLFYILSPDGKRAYFSSARKGGNGDQDLYMVDTALSKKESYVTIIKGKVTENGLPYESEISVSVDGETKDYSIYKSNKESGNYLVNLPSGKKYKVSFYHEIVGDRVLIVDARNVQNYAEKTVNVNFGDGSPTMLNITFGKDGAATTNTLNLTQVREVIEADLVGKYGPLKIPGLTFFIQVAATSTPEKYNKNLLKDICKVREGGVMDNGIKLLVVDKEFETLNDTDEILKKVKAAGQPDAFMTGMYNGKRYYLQDLKKMKVWDKK